MPAHRRPGFCSRSPALAGFDAVSTSSTWFEPRRVRLRRAAPRRVRLVLAVDRRSRRRARRHRRRRTATTAEELGAATGLTSATRSRAPATRFLVNKYYLDDLYDERHRRRRSRARSPAASYWFNQNVIDDVVNCVGRGAARSAASPTTYVDQKVRRRRRQRRRRRAPAKPAALLRQIQTGRVQRYALAARSAPSGCSPCVLSIVTSRAEGSLDELVRRLGADARGLPARWSARSS